MIGLQTLKDYKRQKRVKQRQKRVRNRKRREGPSHQIFDDPEDLYRNSYFVCICNRNLINFFDAFINRLRTTTHTPIDNVRGK